MAALSAAAALAAEPVWLDATRFVCERQDFGRPGIRQAVGGAPLRIAGQRFRRGIGTHAYSALVWRLTGVPARLRAMVGVDDEMVGHPGSVEFQVFGDGAMLWYSGVLRVGDAARPADVDVGGVRRLELRVTDAGDGIDSDHADWAGARLEAAGAGPVLAAARPARPRVAPMYTVASRGIELHLSAEGQIVAASIPGGRPAAGMTGRTEIAGLTATGPEEVARLPSGGMEFRRVLADPTRARRSHLTERFLPAPTGIRWEIDVTGYGPPWTAPIETRLHWPATPASRFWTAWGDSRGGATAWTWRDPLTAVPFGDLFFYYGAPFYQDIEPRVGFWVTSGDLFSIPMATVLELGTGAGLSAILSPRDTLLELTLDTTPDGEINFARRFYRLGGGRTARFALDLVPHAADWRAALSAAVGLYPEYFDPPNSAANGLAGCGAYSWWKGDLDVAKMRRMAFSLNWMASFDFSYMGMFVPPVGDGERWANFRGVETSIPELRDYARWMRRRGFAALCYFSMTEFGTNIAWPPPPRKAALDADLWRDANDFLWATFPEAVLRAPNGWPYGTWGGAVAMDPGEPPYRDFLIEQARRHVREIPDAAGICIDRMDWLRLYNRRRDDGVSLCEGSPARSLHLSWADAMGRLGPIMHGAGKVIFVNPHIKRLEELRQADGIFDEFGWVGPALNLAAWLAVRKPMVAWTAHQSQVMPDPDAFFQRHLHMGAFPMVPYPGNDHSIGPDPAAEAAYLDYGRLLDALRGRRWVLEPRAVEVEGGRALANVFDTPTGRVVTLTFGGKAGRAVVRVRVPVARAGPFAARALLPGEGRPWPAVVRAEGSRLVVETPLKRGCAVVKLMAAGRCPGAG